MNTNLLQSAAKGEDIRNRLIEAAGQVFAEVGYEAATVRQITDRAQANIAAVNYYFGDKLQLYRTVLETVTSGAVALIRQQCAEGAAEKRLRSFVQCILKAESSKEYAWARLLMAREVAELHNAQVGMIVEAIRPMHEIAESIMAELMGKRSGTRVTRFAASLVISLCFNHIPQQRLDQKLYASAGFKEISLEETIEHLSRFVLAGIRGLSNTDSS